MNMMMFAACTKKKQAHMMKIYMHAHRESVPEPFRALLTHPARLFGPGPEVERPCV